MLRPIFLFTLAFALGSLLASARGDDFRVETKVFLENEEEPEFESLTIFSGDVVYSFVLGNGPDNVQSKTVTVFDVRRGRIVLLDGQRKMQTTLTTQQLTDFTVAIQKRSEDDRNRGLFHPVFTTSYDEAERSVTMTSTALTYAVRGETPKDPSAARRYSNFADWYAKLNALMGGLPPFGRIDLNRVLKEKNLLPLEIERTTTLANERSTVLTKKKNVARSEHASNWTLSNTDERRIEHAGQMMASLPSVSLKEFWGIKDKVATNKQ